MKKLRDDIAYFYELSGKQIPTSKVSCAISCFNPRLLPVVFFRFSEFFYLHHVSILSKFFSILNVVIFGIEISPRVEIAGGLFLPHTVGTVIGAERIGKNVTIMQGVTLGTKLPDMHFTSGTRPIIGDHVLIGANAKVLGNVKIGDHSKIGANAVVVTDVPPYASAIGIPARILIPSQN